jgi:ABC-type branched-subunit amino acid transport system substrate-binding protein
MLAIAGLCLAGATRAEPGVTDKEIVFGQTAILSGPLGVPVKGRMVGAELAFAQSRRQGGVYGRSIRIQSIDDELKPERAVANYERLLNEGVIGFFGCGGSATTAAAADILQRSGAPLVGGFAVADGARDKVTGSAYFLRATGKREAEVLVQHLATVGTTRISIAYLDNPGGVEALNLLKAAMDARQLKPVAIAAVKGDGSNVGEAAKALAAVPPQVVIMYLGGPLPGEFIKATSSTDSRPMFYGMSIVAGELTAKIAGDKARGLVIAQVVPYPWSQVDTTAKEFRELAKQAQVPVDYYSFEGYLTGQMLIEALKRTGRDPTRARLAATMRALKFRIGGMDIDFSSGGHTGSSFVELVQVTREGTFVR